MGYGFQLATFFLTTVPGIFQLKLVKICPVLLEANMRPLAGIFQLVGSVGSKTPSHDRRESATEVIPYGKLT